MQAELLNDIVVEIAGEQATRMVNLLIGKKDVNEFLIAKKLKLTINQIRNIFYKFANYGLISFTRKKDKRKGWYTYFWTLNIEKALDLFDNRLKREIEILQKQLESRQTKSFYVCKTCKTEISEENALLHNFTCQECGEVYELNEERKVVNVLKNRINKLERRREQVLQELNKVREEKRKKIAKEETKEKKKRVKKIRKKKQKAKKIKKKKKKAKKQKAKKIKKKKKRK